MAASRKQAKYATLSESYTFQPIALETMDSVNEPAAQFLNEVGSRISSVSADDKEESSSNDCLPLCKDKRYFAARVIWE